VLIGYSTPHMGGIEATRRLVGAYLDTRVMLIGATDDPKRVADALESGAIGYMLLDTPPGDIATTLRRLVKES
jgi:two-component system, NarL family, response regulator DegU